FPLSAMVALEGLSMVLVVLAARGVTNMADGGAAGVFAQDVLGLGRVIEAKRLDDGADLLVGGQDVIAMRIERGHAGGELTTVLRVDEHANQQARHLFRAVTRNEVRGCGAFQVIDGRDPTFMAQFVHDRPLDTGNSLGPGPSLLYMIASIRA